MFRSRRLVKYINLTNGLERFTINPEIAKNCRFIRIQSTALEQNHLEAVIRDLDNDFLMNLAIGNDCKIYDYGSRTGNISRALWYGVPWIEYVLNRIWFGYIPIMVLISPDQEHHYNVADYFDKQFRNILSNSTKRKIKYYRKFLFCSNVEIQYSSLRTEHDGDHKFYKKLVEDFVLENPYKNFFAWRYLKVKLAKYLGLTILILYVAVGLVLSWSFGINLFGFTF